MPKDVMGVKWSGIGRQFQNFWFGALFFSQTGEKLKNILKNSQFLRRFEVFWTFLNFEWKKAHQTKDFVKPLQFCFFSHPWHPWAWMSSGWNKILSKLPVCGCFAQDALQTLCRRSAMHSAFCSAMQSSLHSSLHSEMCSECTQQCTQQCTQASLLITRLLLWKVWRRRRTKFQ